jgi:hypothetical protein
MTSPANAEAVGAFVMRTDTELVLTSSASSTDACARPGSRSTSPSGRRRRVTSWRRWRTES